MTRRAVDALFLAMFALTDIRAILRTSAPDHRLDETEKEEVRRLIAQVRQQVSHLEEDLAS
ncbi:MAG TPA: hypothetical protein VE134_05295 [Methanomicrobiales archaeon]|nr:hypothetical protein [Methanomicrobiales archaeon]HZD43457.1 hypothetical protein [Methanomicrobiales archaeon]